MLKPKALALFCLGATTTTTTATATTSVSAFQAWCTRGMAKPRSRGRGGGGDGRGSHRYLAKRRAPGRRYASPTGKEDDIYGGNPDYSEYGYEPDYELQDEAQLEEWRTERLLVNDRWQFRMYEKQSVGNWLGMWQEYVAQELRGGGEPEQDGGDEIAPMVGIVPGKHFPANTRISRRDIKLLEGTNVFEHQHQAPDDVPPSEFSCPEPVVETLFSDSFRGGNGTQVAGNTYTMAEARSPARGTRPEEDLGDVWVEVGLREGDVRMRSVFQYGRAAEGASLRRVFLVREGLERLPPGDGTMEPELYGSAGKGLYDTPPRSRSPLYFSIYAEGGLTLRFPLKVETGGAGVFSMDWTAGAMRYQADRVFDVLDGSCRRLEVTEIGTQDAEIFLPVEKF